MSTSLPGLVCTRQRLIAQECPVPQLSFERSIHSELRPVIGWSQADSHRASYCLILALAAFIRAAKRPLAVFSFPGGMKIGFHSSMVPALCSLAGSLHPIGKPSTIEFHFPMAVRLAPCRAAIRARTAALGVLRTKPEIPDAYTSGCGGQHGPSSVFCEVFLHR